MPARLRLAWIEGKTKRVHFISGRRRDVRSKIDAEKIAEDAATTAKVVKGINPRQKPDTK
jgi:hypothetical protein